MFYTKTFFKYSALRFTPPGKIDEDFYVDMKQRLADDVHFKLESDIDFWQAYRGFFIVFVLFTVSLIFVAFFLLTGTIPGIWLRGIPLFLIILLLQPTIYFIILMVYYYRYRMSENQFHNDFRKALADSGDFLQFSDKFYTGKYAAQAELKEYQFEGEINVLKDFVEDRELTGLIAVYKYSKPPYKFVILSTNYEINRFMESLESAQSLRRDNPIRRVIKNQTEIPCMFGNKRLSELMELSS